MSLEHHAEMPAERLQRDVPHVVAVNADRPGLGATNRATRNETMIENTGETSIGSGEDGLINALRRERTRYHERQSALLARCWEGSGSSRRGPVRKIAPGTGHPVGRTTVGVA